MPSGLNWDSWIGPAAMRPYHRAYHPSTWRCWWDFGCGMMGDRGVHTLDSVVTALKLGRTVEHRRHLLRLDQGSSSSWRPWSRSSSPPAATSRP